jgi:hypothetical protein
MVTVHSAWTDSFVSADTSTPTDAGSLCVGSTVGTLRSNAASSRTKEEAILHTMSPQKVMRSTCNVVRLIRYLRK